MVRQACRSAWFWRLVGLIAQVFLLHAAVHSSRQLLSVAAFNVPRKVRVSTSRNLPYSIGTVILQQPRAPPPFARHYDCRDLTPPTVHGLPLLPRRGGVGRTTTKLHAAAAGFTAIDAFMKANPLIAAAVVCATKASAADWVAQKRQQRLQHANNTATGQPRRKLSFRRLFSFIVYGALYQGVAQELIYNGLYTRIFGSATTLDVVVKKVLFDAVFHNALICIPMAYAVKAFIFQYSLATGIRQYIDDVMHHGLLLKYYALWMPVNAMLFTIVPTHWRITVMACVSFFWMIILSTISSRTRTDNV